MSERRGEEKEEGIYIIYIYIYRERERERERVLGRGRRDVDSKEIARKSVIGERRIYRRRVREREERRR